MRSEHYKPTNLQNAYRSLSHREAHLTRLFDSRQDRSRKKGFFGRMIERLKKTKKAAGSLSK